MASIRPFQFKNLPRTTKQHVAFRESLTRYVSYHPFEPDFADSLASAASEVLKVPVQFAKPTLSDGTVTGLTTLLPQTPCVAVIGTGVGDHKILLDLDPHLAAMTIELLLGGPPQLSRFARALTDIEAGVLSFLLLRVLSHFHNGWETGRELALTLERVTSAVTELEAFASPKAGFQMISVRVNVAQHGGAVRAFIPNAFITERFGAAEDQSGATPQELAYMRRQFAALAERSVTAHLTATRLELSPDDIANIETGDIILLENHGLQKTAAGIEGTVFVTIGLGKNGGFKGRLRIEGEQVGLEVVEIITQEQPLEASMADGQHDDDDDDGDNLPETEGLLRDVDATVAVELGRIRMNTAQVVRLRRGQVLRLARGPLDPVDLVVNGKLFARAELVEVDGELGVRLTQVTGAE